MGGGRDPGGPAGPAAIVVSGPAACGKTTFATALARRLGFALFDLDQVTGPLSAAALGLLGQAEHAFDEEGPGKELREARYGSLVEAARANLSIGSGVVLAAPFTRELADPAAWRNLVDGLAAPAPSSGAHTPAVALVYLNCPAPVIFERLRTRGAARDRLKLEGQGSAQGLGAHAPPKVPYLEVDGTLPTLAQVETVLLGLGLSSEVPALAGGRGSVRNSGGRGRKATEPPTVLEVATLAGVSIKTVSRVVNDEPGVTAKTANRVRDAIDTLGYRPNPLARSLRRGRDEAVALVVERIGDPFFASMTEAVEEAAREAGLFLIIASAGESAAQERAVISGLLHRSVCGLIARASRLDFARERFAIGAGGVPVVFVDSPSGFAAADSVLVDNTDTARRATAHLIAHGHRRIAFVGTALDRLPLRWRLEGYRAALADAGIDYDGELVVSHTRFTRDHPPFLSGVLGLRGPATAVLSANAMASIDVVAELHRGSRTDVAFVGFDDFPMAGFLTPAVTVARQDPALMGSTAMALLVQRIRGDSSPPKQVVLPTTFVVRGSGEIPPPEMSSKNKEEHGHVGRHISS